MLSSGTRFVLASLAVWSAVALLVTPYFVWEFGPWGLLISLDVALGYTMVTFGGWLVWRFGRKQANSLLRWGAWWGGAIGLTFLVLVASLEAMLIGGHPIVLFMTALLGVFIVPAAVILGMVIGEIWTVLLRWTGHDPLVFD